MLVQTLCCRAACVAFRAVAQGGFEELWPGRKYQGWAQALPSHSGLGQPLLQVRAWDPGEGHDAYMQPVSAGTKKGVTWAPGEREVLRRDASASPWESFPAAGRKGSGDVLSLQPPSALLAAIGK